jgi:hypothetical protein
VPAPSPLKEPPRSLTTTLAPLEAKNKAYAFPSPPPAPVTTTVWPSYRNSDMVNVDFSPHALIVNERKESGSSTGLNKFNGHFVSDLSSLKEYKIGESESCFAEKGKPRVLLMQERIWRKQHRGVHPKLPKTSAPTILAAYAGM